MKISGKKVDHITTIRCSKCLAMLFNVVVVFSFQTKHVVEDELLAQKVKIIKELGDHLTVLEKMKGDNYGLGEYVFDGQI